MTVSKTTQNLKVHNGYHNFDNYLSRECWNFLHDAGLHTRKFFVKPRITRQPRKIKPGKPYAPLILEALTRDMKKYETRNL